MKICFKNPDSALFVAEKSSFTIQGTQRDSQLGLRFSRSSCLDSGLLKQILLFSLFFSSCGILTQGSQLDVVDQNGGIQTINMAPRHYLVKEHCVDIVGKATPNLLKSASYLAPSDVARLPWYSRLKSYRVEDCAKFHKRGAMMKDYAQLYADREDKIGVVLPPAAANEPALQLILEEYREALKRNGVDPEKTLVVRRIEKKEEAALKAAAELVHLDRVSLLVGVNSIHSAALAKIADPTQVPVFLVNPNAAHSKSRQTMRVYPPMDRLAQKLLDVYLAAGVSHVTVLYPNGADLDLFHDIKRLAGNRIYFMDTSYDPESKYLLERVSQAVHRMAMVRTKSQAVLILDNFKMVRHMVNMIRTGLGDGNVVISGNQQWRSPALVTPREEALEGALFVDFIGNYTDLPPALAAPTPESPLFTTAQVASKLDYQLIGHRLGTLSSAVIRSMWSRQRIATELQELHNSWDNYFPPTEMVFDQNRDSSWPAFLFRVKGESIEIVN